MLTFSCRLLKCCSHYLCPYFLHLTERHFNCSSFLLAIFSLGGGWGEGFNEKCLREKEGKLPIPNPEPTSSHPSLPALWIVNGKGRIRTNDNNSLLYPTIIECLLNARSFHIQWKHLGQDLTLGRYSKPVADWLTLAKSAKDASVLRYFTPFNDKSAAISRER